MLPASFLLLVTAALTVWGQGQPEQLESANFNAKEALLIQGFDEAIIPVAPDHARAPDWACTAAVRNPPALPITQFSILDRTQHIGPPPTIS